MRTAIDQYLYLLDQAFEGHGEHALLANVRSLTDDTLRWLPPGGGRSAAAILLHVGEARFVYESHAFGDGSRRWDRPGTIPTIPADSGAAKFEAWLRDSHDTFRSSVEALGDDRDLLTPRRAPWGEAYETRWLINVMAQHDLYHAGEINHIRALHKGDDRWSWD